MRIAGLRHAAAPSARGRWARLAPLLAALLLAGCRYDNSADLYPGTFCDTTHVTWSGTIEPLIQSSCAIPGCHVPGLHQPDLSTYAGVKAAADEGLIRGVVIDGVPYFMPAPPVGLPPCDRLQVQAWLNAGAPED